MAQKSITLSLPEDLDKRLEEYIKKHHRAYITARGIKNEILIEALKEWLDKHEG